MPKPQQTDVNKLLEKAGIEPKVAEAVIEIDAQLQQWRRRAARRELGNRALHDLKIDLDLAQLDVLSAIQGTAPEFGEVEGETMIATVAERLAIDPSRASRMVSDLVERGLARRAVSQADARRTIIELTEAGTAVVSAVRAYKFLVMGQFLSDWSQDDIAAFVPMFRRFSTWTESIESSSGKHAGEIDALAANLKGHSSA